MSPRTLRASPTVSGPSFAVGASNCSRQPVLIELAGHESGVLRSVVSACRAETAAYLIVDRVRDARLARLRRALAFTSAAGFRKPRLGWLSLDRLVRRLLLASVVVGLRAWLLSCFSLTRARTMEAHFAKRS